MRLESTSRLGAWDVASLLTVLRYVYDYTCMVGVLSRITALLCGDCGDFVYIVWTVPRPHEHTQLCKYASLGAPMIIQEPTH